MNAVDRDTQTDPLAHLDDAERAELALARRAAHWVGLILPLLLTAVATIVLVLWIPRMPDPLAVHWGTGEGPDGFGPPWMNAAMSLGLGIGLTALYGVQGLQRWQAKQQGGAIWSSAYRILPAIVLGTVVFLQTLSVGMAWKQLDLADARDTGSVWPVMLVGFGLWIAATAIGYLVQPRLRIDGPDAEPVDPLPMQPGERAVWIGQVRPTRGLVWTTVLLLALLAATAIWAASVDPVAGLVAGGSFLLVLVLTSTGLWFRVRVDATGLEARAPLGWPVFRLRADDVASVTATRISPLAEYGGWGLRWTPDRFGIVMRTGEGLVATRRNGRLFGITIDDAATATALLAAYAGAAGRSSSPSD